LSNIFIGSDIVEVDRIRSSIDQLGEKFLNRIFTESEQQYCDSKSDSAIHYAGRFAAKEAIMKALKSGGHTFPIPFNSISIQNSETGVPIVEIPHNISGNCRVSISHIQSHATAAALYIIE